MNVIFVCVLIYVVSVYTAKLVFKINDGLLR